LSATEKITNMKILAKALAYSCLSLACLSPGYADVYNYMCKFNGKNSPLVVDETKEVLIWQGLKYHVTVTHGDGNGGECGKYCWLAKGHGTSFAVSTATQGYADFTLKGTEIECQSEEGRRRQAEIEAENASEETSVESNPRETSNGKTKTYLASQDIFLRAEPNPNSENLLGPPPYDYIPKNTRISVHVNQCTVYHADTRDSQWRKADYSDYSGWVNTRYLIN
jgi:hypothetical protein